MVVPTRKLSYKWARMQEQCLWIWNIFVTTMCADIEEDIGCVGTVWYGYVGMSNDEEVGHLLKAAPLTHSRRRIGGDVRSKMKAYGDLLGGH